MLTPEQIRLIQLLAQAEVERITGQRPTLPPVQELQRQGNESRRQN